MDNLANVPVDRFYPGGQLTGKIVNLEPFETAKAGVPLPCYYEVKLQDGTLRMIKHLRTFVDINEEYNLVENLISDCQPLKLDHLILRYEDYYHESEGSFYLATEYFECTLYEYVMNLGNLRTIPESQAVPILASLLLLLDALKVGPYIHRFISPHSIVLVRNPDTQELMPKLTDFSLAVKGSSSAHVNNDPNYTSPIIVSNYRPMMASSITPNHEYGQSVDVWSLLVVYYFMLYGREPFQMPKNPADVKELSGVTGNKLNFPTHIKVSEKSKSLLREFLKVNQTLIVQDLVENVDAQLILDQPVFDHLRDSMNLSLSDESFNADGSLTNLRTSVWIPTTKAPIEVRTSSSSEDMTDLVKTAFQTQIQKVFFIQEVQVRIKELFEKANPNRETTLQCSSIIQNIIVLGNLLEFVRDETISDLTVNLQQDTANQKLRQVFQYIEGFGPSELQIVFEKRWGEFQNRFQEEIKRFKDATKPTKESAWILTKFRSYVSDKVITDEGDQLWKLDHLTLLKKLQWYSAVTLKDLISSNKLVKSLFKESCTAARQFLLDALYEVCTSLRLVGVNKETEKLFGDNLKMRIYNSKSWGTNLDHVRNRQMKQDHTHYTKEILPNIQKLRDPRRTSRFTCGKWTIATFLILLILAVVLGMKLGWFAKFQQKAKTFDF